VVYKVDHLLLKIESFINFRVLTFFLYFDLDFGFNVMDVLFLKIIIY